MLKQIHRFDLCRIAVFARLPAMAETQEGLQRPREEVKIGQIIKFLQSLDVVLTENRDIFTVLPELHKRFVEPEANITNASRTATSHSTR